MDGRGTMEEGLVGGDTRGVGEMATDCFEGDFSKELKRMSF